MQIIWLVDDLKAAIFVRATFTPVQHGRARR